MKLSRDDLDPAGGSGRYDRQSLIEWWDQDKIDAARVLLVGAGALGNEILKVLTLVGVGNLLVLDMDRIETSNLSRGVFLRDGDLGRNKADVIAARARELNPGVRVESRGIDVTREAGLGLFLWADVVIGAVDNREARIFINSACAATGRIWVDGAIEGFAGTVRGFDPRRGPCYECTMSAVDRRIVAERRSCALLARRIVESGHVPNTAVTASLVGALQAQEALKVLHGLPALVGEGLHIDGLNDDFSRVSYPRRDDCSGHEDYGTIRPLGWSVTGPAWTDLVARAEQELGSGAVVELSRDLVLDLTCPSCGQRERGGVVLGAVDETRARCPECGEHRVVRTVASLGRGEEIEPGLTPADLGLPPFDVVMFRKGSREEAWLFDRDAGAALGCLAATFEREGP